jgi:hypothetical protein
MSRSVEQIIHSLHKDRGNINESNVRSAIGLLLESGELDFVSRNINLDCKGIDWLVGRGTKRYKLSVKSSEAGKDEELRKLPQRHRHGDRIFIIHQKGETREELARRIISLINCFEEKMHER